MKLIPRLFTIVPGTIVTGPISGVELNLSVDSRTIQPGEIFIALTGKNVDGHQYVHDAFNKGAVGAIVQQDVGEVDGKFIIQTPNTLDLLIRWAKYSRDNFGGQVIGLTGSVGKTTTKAMIKSILDASNINAFVSHGNQNSNIGLSMNLLKLNNDYDCAVFEMGINEVGEMEELVDIARPTSAAITNISAMHTEGLGGLEGVIKEKTLIFSRITDGVGIVPNQPWVDKMIFSHTTHRLDEDICAKHVHVDEFLTFQLSLFGESKDVVLNVANAAFVDNALIAAGVCNLLGVSLDTIVMGLKNFVPVEGRFEKKALVKKNGVIINDCYNAGPESMQAALEAFSRLKHNGTKIAVLGDMLELGELANEKHKELGELLKKYNFDSVILVGDLVKQIADFPHASTWQEAYQLLEEALLENSMILVKGSNGVGLRNLVDALC